MLLGMHPSIAGGLQNAPKEARETFDAECFQMFSKNQRQWKAKPLTDEDVEAFGAALDEHGYDPKHVFIHASYLINLASPKPEMRQKSVDALADELDRATRLGVLGVCFHPGSHTGSGEEAGSQRILKGIEEVLDRVGPGSLLMIEGTAGTGDNLGYAHEHLATWTEPFPEDRLAITLDTCHLFAAGHDLRPSKYDETMAAMDDAFGLDRVRCWHLNDSEHPLGSRKDRHACIGEGEIGTGAFERLINDPRFQGVPASLETEYERYADDLATLRKIRTAAP